MDREDCSALVAATGIPCPRSSSLSTLPSERKVVYTAGACVLALDAKNGQVVWVRRLPLVVPPTGAPALLAISTAAHNGTIVAGEMHNYDTPARIWILTASGDIIVSFCTRMKGIQLLNVSQDGKYILCVCNTSPDEKQAMLCVWEASGNLICQQSVKASLRALTLYANNTRLIAAGDASMHLWSVSDASNGRIVLTKLKFWMGNDARSNFVGMVNQASGHGVVALTADGHLLYVGEASKSGPRIERKVAAKVACTSVAAGHSAVAVAGSDGTVRLFAAQDLKYLGEVPVPGSAEPLTARQARRRISSLAGPPAVAVALATNEHSTIILYGSGLLVCVSLHASEREQGCIQWTVEGHGSCIGAMTVLRQSDSVPLLAATVEDASVRLWSAAKTAVPGTGGDHKGSRVDCVDLRPAGTLHFSVPERGTGNLHMRFIRSSQPASQHDCYTPVQVIAASERLLAIVDAGSRLHIFDAVCQKRHPWQAPQDGHVTAAAFAPLATNGHIALALGLDCGSVQIVAVHLGTCTLMQELRGFGGKSAVAALSFARTGNVLICMHAKGQLRFWRVCGSQYQLYATQTLSKGDSMVVTPANMAIVLEARCEELKVYEIASGEHIATVQLQGASSAARVHAVGAAVVVASCDGSLQVLDPSLQICEVLTSHTALVVGIAYERSLGLVTASLDGMMHTWSMPARLRHLMHHAISDPQPLALPWPSLVSPLMGTAGQLGGSTLGNSSATLKPGRALPPWRPGDNGIQQASSAPLPDLAPIITQSPSKQGSRAFASRFEPAVGHTARVRARASWDFGTKQRRLCSPSTGVAASLVRRSSSRLDTAAWASMQRQYCELQEVVQEGLLSQGSLGHLSLRSSCQLPSQRSRTLQQLAARPLSASFDTTQLELAKASAFSGRLDAVPEGSRGASSAENSAASPAVRSHNFSPIHPDTRSHGQCVSVEVSSKRHLSTEGQRVASCGKPDPAGLLHDKPCRSSCADLGGSGEVVGQGSSTPSVVEVTLDSRERCSTSHDGSHAASFNFTPPREFNNMAIAMLDSDLTPPEATLAESPVEVGPVGCHHAHQPVLLSSIRRSDLARGFEWTCNNAFSDNRHSQECGPTAPKAPLFVQTPGASRYEEGATSPQSIGSPLAAGADPHCPTPGKCVSSALEAAQPPLRDAQTPPAITSMVCGDCTESRSLRASTQCQGRVISPAQPRPLASGCDAEVSDGECQGAELSARSLQVESGWLPFGKRFGAGHISEAHVRPASRLPLAQASLENKVASPVKPNLFASAISRLTNRHRNGGLGEKEALARKVRSGGAPNAEPLHLVPAAQPHGPFPSKWPNDGRPGGVLLPACAGSGQPRAADPVHALESSRESLDARDGASDTERHSVSRYAEPPVSLPVRRPAGAGGRAARHQPPVLQAAPSLGGSVSKPAASAWQRTDAGCAAQAGESTESGRFACEAVAAAPCSVLEGQAAAARARQGFTLATELARFKLEQTLSESSLGSPRGAMAAAAGALLLAAEQLRRGAHALAPGMDSVMASAGDASKSHQVPFDMDMLREMQFLQISLLSHTNGAA